MIAENPKALFVAISGLIIYLLKVYLFKDSFSPEIESWLNIILPCLFLYLFGKFTRITKTQAEQLKEIECVENKNKE